MNISLACDGYKLDHRRQYPPKTTKVYSNWTPRSSRIKGQNAVIFFGLQYFLQKYLQEDFGVDFFGRPLENVVHKYAKRINSYLGPNQIGVDHIADLWKLGYLPLEFKAVPEGTLVPLRVPMFTVENTQPEFFWLVNYLESLISSVMWLPCTSATTALRYRKLLNKEASISGGDPEFVPWQGHDFSFRGMASPEAAALSGAAHLLSFQGTDTIPAIELIEDYYNPSPETLIGGSVPATEHSVMCAGGEDGERATFERLLDLYPTGIVSVVSDTWDLWKVLTDVLPSLKDRILAREGKLVIRPDSGDPVKIICGDTGAPQGSPERMGVVRLLWQTFGGTLTKAGFKQLDSHIGVIYGDAITEERAKEICSKLSMIGFASTNMVYGIGSFTYQYVTRDTFGFAMKATWVEVAGQGRDIFKAPKTDTDKSKFSAKGRLGVSDKLELVTEAENTILQTVWKDGEFTNYLKFEDIRKRVLDEAARFWN